MTDSNTEKTESAPESHPRMPVQPTLLDKHKRLRFAQNRIVVKLLEDSPFSMNDIARWVHADGIANQNELFQFDQLIGYSVDGIPYPDDASRAEVKASYRTGPLSGPDALVKFYEERQLKVRTMLLDGLAELYECHPTNIWEQPDP